jgi:CxxC motif-containing protein
MSERELVCVVCPNGCAIRVESAPDGTVSGVSGHRCSRGEQWARQEMRDPLRTIASSVLVEGGDRPLVSVRTDRAIPLSRVRDVMEEIRKLRPSAPIRIGQVLLSSPAGCETRIVATRRISRA